MYKKVAKDGYCIFDVVHYAKSDVFIWGSSHLSENGPGVMPCDTLNNTLNTTVPLLPIVNKMTGCIKPLHKLGPPFNCDPFTAEEPKFYGHMDGGRAELPRPERRTFFLPRGVYWPASYKTQISELRTCVGIVLSSKSRIPSEFSHCLVLMKDSLTCFSRHEIDEAPNVALPSAMQIGDECIATGGDLGRVCLEAGVQGFERAHFASYLMGPAVPFRNIAQRMQDLMNRNPAVVPGVTISWSVSG